MVISLDFDNTVYSTPEDEKMGKLVGQPLPGAFEAMDQLLSEGHELQIFTARTDFPRIKTWLKENGFDLDVSNVKYPADVYIDDRGVSFRGDWKQTLEETENFIQELEGRETGV